MAKKLSEKQYAAIALLSLPKRGGMTYAEIAEEVGIAESTLREWRKQDAFNDEIKKQVLRNAVDRLPDIFDSVPNHIIEEGNAAMFRTYVQSLGMLTEKHEVETKESGAANIDDIKAKIAQYKGEDSEG